jgi:16S rRNA (cytidine1402-2'-O)-methyltransferase
LSVSGPVPESAESAERRRRGTAQPGTLHLVPVPLLNTPVPAGDPGGAEQVLPASTLAVARRARYFLAENARSARAFLKSIAHEHAIASLRIEEIGHQPDPGRINDWLAPLLGNTGTEGIDAVLLSEAGCPGVADPGATLVARAHALGIPVAPWVGPSAILLALMASGMNGQQFRFLGYLPQERAALGSRLLAVQRDARRGETQIFIETPYRNERLFDAVLELCDVDLLLCVAVGLTGPDQSALTRPIRDWRRIAAQDRPALHRRPAVFALHGSDMAADAGARGPARPGAARSP